MMTVRTPNAELAYKVLDHIDAHPEQWDQGDWYRETGCGTVACFAGWAVKLSGREVVLSERPLGQMGCQYGRFVQTPDGRRHFREAGIEVLGIDVFDADDLFDGTNSREALGSYVAQIFGPRPGGAS